MKTIYDRRRKWVAEEFKKAMKKRPKMSNSQKEQVKKALQKKARKEVK